MTGPGVPRVDVGSLNLGAELGRGGQGKVTAVTGFLVEGQWTAALKRYSSDVLAQADTAVLHELVYFPRQLSPGNGRWLLGNTAWPAVLAEDNGAICGFLMRTVPRRYYFDRQTQTLGSRQQLADIAYVLNDDSYVRDVGLSVSDWHRIALLKDLAGTLARLHSLGVIFGDFSPKNVLFSLQGAPSCFLIDCDAVQLNGESVTRQVQTPDWEAPAAETRATAATDAYKFGLLAIRLFARDQSSRDTTALRKLSPELGMLAQLSQQSDPQCRPLPAAWIAPLEEAANSGAAQCTATASKQRPTTPPHRFSVPSAPVGGLAATSPRVAGLAAPRRWRAPAALATAALLVLLLVVLVLAKATSGAPSQDAATSGPARTQTHTPEDPVKAKPLPTSVGLVTIGSRIARDPRAVAVAHIFNIYFRGINKHHYHRALSVFDPNGQMDPNDNLVVNTFAQGDATSTDSHVVLVRIGAAGTRPADVAEVTFRSKQAAGYGPADNPRETCTLWDITYRLVQSSSGSYLINKVQSVSDSGC